MPVVRDDHAELLLIESVRSGDRFAFTELVRTQDRWIRSIVFGVLGRADALDDVCQQVWASVWGRIGELRDSGSWRSWTYRLARNAAIDAWRDTTRRRRAAATGQLAEGVALATPDRDACERERDGAVLDAVQSLPAIYREPFVLRHVHGWGYRQIAELMEMPVDSIETRLVRARRLLREALKDRVL